MDLKIKLSFFLINNSPLHSTQFHLKLEKKPDRNCQTIEYNYCTDNALSITRGKIEIENLKMKKNFFFNRWISHTMWIASNTSSNGCWKSQTSDNVWIGHDTKCKFGWGGSGRWNENKIKKKCKNKSFLSFFFRFSFIGNPSTFIHQQQSGIAHLLVSFFCHFWFEFFFCHFVCLHSLFIRVYNPTTLFDDHDFDDMHTNTKPACVCVRVCYLIRFSQVFFSIL